MSRSKLYAQALEKLLDEEPDDEITRALEAVYSKEKSKVDRDLAAAQRRATAEKW
jgi:metal-responsive CopG/Arc/MetJ family transcriptional regulator